MQLYGYFQSWRYFYHIEDKLRKYLQFKDEIVSEACSQFRNVTFNKSRQTTVFIGVHVRRADIVSNQGFVDYGHVSADMDYLQRSMNYFRDKYRDVLFVVSSDDLAWCHDYIQEKDAVFVNGGNNQYLDMAILIQTNHTLMTVGSFGWWTAWLTGGETVYYGKYPQPRSQLDALFTKTDYYPPAWKLM
jgi:galactoside 2-L-fucosyltransferase 1/2